MCFLLNFIPVWMIILEGEGEGRRKVMIEIILSENDDYCEPPLNVQQYDVFSESFM